MNKLKRFLSMTLAVVLIIPFISSANIENVYAAYVTETLTLSSTSCSKAGNGSSSKTGSTTLVDLGDIEVASVSLSTSVAYNSKGLRQTSASATFYVTNESGELLKTSDTVSNGSSNTVSIDCKDLTGHGYFKVDFSATGYTTEGSGAAREGSASSSNITIYKLGKPVFSSILANGNSCVQNDGNLTHFKISAF